MADLKKKLFPAFFLQLEAYALGCDFITPVYSVILTTKTDWITSNELFQHYMILISNSTKDDEKQEKNCKIIFFKNMFIMNKYPL